MQPEFSHIIKLSEIGDKEIVYEISANEEERIALAQRLNIKEVKSFTATVSLHKSGEFLVKANGSFEAKIIQTSVISLEDFTSDIKESFSTTFSNQTSEKEAVEIDIDEEDTEIIHNNQIDIGELATEYLALAVPTFPKKEGEVFSYTSKEQEFENKEKNAFSVLEKLK